MTDPDLASLSEFEQYANPAALVSSDWLAAHLTDPNLRIVELDSDFATYTQAHIPGAVGWNRLHDLQHPTQYDIPNSAAFQALLERSGITPETLVVIYGDQDNWLAAYGFWLLQLYGHSAVKLLDGGRKKWVTDGHPLSDEQPLYPPSDYGPVHLDESQRIRRGLLLARIGQAEVHFIDTRQPAEFTGELLAPSQRPNEFAQRGGHIPGALNVVWNQVVTEDGSFKSRFALQSLYQLPLSELIIVYNSTGERAAHTWFVLKHLLGYEDVRNYDGGWVEYGNLLSVSITKTYQSPTTSDLNYSI